MVISNKFFNKLETKGRKLGVRERVLLTVLVLVIVYMFWQNAIMGGLYKKHGQIILEQKQVEQDTKILQAQYKVLSKEVSEKKVESLATRISSLKSLNKTLESDIVSLTKNLIPPKKMLTLLQDILAQDDTVSVVNLKNLPETQFFTTSTTARATSKDGEEVKLEIFKHGIEIEVDATYFGVMEFLYKLEQLPWNLIWDSFKYEVTTYPMAKVKFVVYTLSLSDNWIDLG